MLKLCAKDAQAVRLRVERILSAPHALYLAEGFIVYSEVQPQILHIALIPAYGGGISCMQE